MRTAFITRHKYLQLLVAFSMLALAGCSGDAPLSDPAEATIAENESTTPQAPVDSDNSPPTEPTQVDPNTPAVEPPAEPLSYEAPFPDRFDLFVPPKRRAQRAKSSNTKDGTVELIGFATVGGREVVLSIIDGSVFPLAEGETHSGVEVISIKQPAVVLQRGREKWQVSLNN